MTARAYRSVAAREVVSASERLMRGLLDQERVCVVGLDEGVARIAQEISDRVRVRAKAKGRAELARSVDDFLPNRATVEPILLPPIGDLLAMTRQRSLEVVGRHMRACQSTVETRWRYLATAGLNAARADATVLERHWYERANEGLSEVGAVVRADMLAQYRLWANADEPVDLLLRRWMHPEEVRLPGSATRGVVWGLRTRMVAEARNAHIALSNGVVLAGMRGWNGG